MCGMRQECRHLGEPEAEIRPCAVVESGFAKRLKLIDEAKAKGVTLQIFDGNAIAEWLAEPDIFWIAQEYLHLPSDVTPVGEIEEGYVDHRQKWQSRTPIPINRAHFLAIKAGVREPAEAFLDDQVLTFMGL
jgi:hypothetical protein